MEIAPFLLLELLLWVACMLLSLRFLSIVKKGRKQGCSNAGNVPSVTVVIVTQDDEVSLRKVLPMYLGQRYASEFVVLVADIHSTDGTMDYLEGMEEVYPHLSHTSVPSSARDISLQRLAMTLGVRSACTDWVVFTDSGCCPQSDTWLSSFMSLASEGKDAVLGQTLYRPWEGWMECKMQFFRLWQQSLWLPFSRSHVPYMAEESLLAYRKECFMEHGGFGADVNLNTGAATLLVNKNISRGRCEAALSKESALIQTFHPYRKWDEDRLFFMETRRHTHHSFLYRLWYACNVFVPIVFGLLTMGLIIWHIPNYLVISILSFMWIAVLLSKVFAFRFLCKYLGVRGFSVMYLLLEVLIPLWDLTAWLKWVFTSKKTFRKKFV